MRLHSLGFLSLSQDHKQVIIGQEVEPRKHLPLLLQIIIKRLLDLIKLLISIIELPSNSILIKQSQNPLISNQKIHSISPNGIHHFKISSLSRHLLMNIIRCKYRLKIHPPSLTLSNRLYQLRYLI